MIPNGTRVSLLKSVFKLGSIKARKDILNVYEGMKGTVIGWNETEKRAEIEFDEPFFLAPDFKNNGCNGKGEIDYCFHIPIKHLKIESFMQHTTRNGETILISEMEDSHLKNTISYKIKKLRMAKAILRANNEKPDEFFESIYNRPRLSKSEAKNHVKYFMKNVAPYILEMMIREEDVSECISDIQTLLERKSQLSEIDIPLLQESNNFEDADLLDGIAEGGDND